MYIYVCHSKVKVADFETHKSLPIFISETQEKVMDKADPKSLSEIYEKLAALNLSSNDKEKQSESSTSPSLTNHGGDLSTNGKVRPKANCVETSPEYLSPKQKVHGFVNETLFLKNFLLKSKELKEFKALGVVGKYGVGKTTLCQDVFNDKDVRRAYLPRLWVSMYIEAKEGDRKVAVVKRILRSLGVEDDILARIEKDAKEEKSMKAEEGKSEEETVEEKELSKLLDVLNSNLFGKKYLIVFDDVWEDNEWNQRLDDEKNQSKKPHLSRGFPKEFGGRVIVTTRDDKLAKNIVGEEENLLRLFPRSDAESVWMIYSEAVKKATGIEVNPKYPDRFKQELMDKSGGTPLAALMLGKKKPVKMDDTKKSS